MPQKDFENSSSLRHHTCRLSNGPHLSGTVPILKPESRVPDFNLPNVLARLTKLVVVAIKAYASTIRYRNKKPRITAAMYVRWLMLENVCQAYVEVSCFSLCECQAKSWCLQLYQYGDRLKRSIIITSYFKRALSIDVCLRLFQVLSKFVTTYHVCDWCIVT